MILKCMIFVKSKIAESISIEFEVVNFVIFSDKRFVFLPVDEFTYRMRQGCYRRVGNMEKDGVVIQR